MHTGLLKYINEHTSSVLSSEEVILIESVFKPKKIKKNNIFYKKEMYANIMHLLLKGQCDNSALMIKTQSISYI